MGKLKYVLQLAGGIILLFSCLILMDWVPNSSLWDLVSQFKNTCIFAGCLMATAGGWLALIGGMGLNGDLR